MKVHETIWKSKQYYHCSKSNHYKYDYETDWHKSAPYHLQKRSESHSIWWTNNYTISITSITWEFQCFCHFQFQRLQILLFTSCLKSKTPGLNKKSNVQQKQNKTSKLEPLFANVTDWWLVSWLKYTAEWSLVLHCRMQGLVSAYTAIPPSHDPSQFTWH